MGNTPQNDTFDDDDLIVRPDGQNVGPDVGPDGQDAETVPGIENLLGDFVRLEHERRRLEEELGAVKKKLSAIDGPLTELFAANGLQNLRKDGLTVFLKRDRYVSRKSGASNESLCEELKKVGLGYMVGESYNPSSLRSVIRELEDNGNLPESLAALLNIGEAVKLATRVY